jgi:hypothetical protein
MIKNTFLFGVFLGIAFFVACKKDDTTPQPSVETSSFDLIQSKILTPSCATPGCHATELDGLVLTKELSYERMFEVTPTNATAKSDGLKIIQAFNAEKSLLFHKVHVDPDHHTGDYGEIMPIGGSPLKDGQVEFIKRWINAGAPKTGDIVDKSLLD